MSLLSDPMGDGLLVPELVTRAPRWAGPGTLGNLLLLLGITFVLCCAAVYRERYRRLVRHIDRIPGPATVPIVGNALQINADREELFNRIIASRKLYGRHQGISRIWNGLTPYVLISKAQVVEKILSSTRNIEKGRDYEFLQPWLGTGLLTSSAGKWQHRRKILTPAFHFRILSDFVGVFNQQASVLVDKLRGELGNEAGFDCVRYITLCSLDIICETAMGCPVYAQHQSDSEYVKAHEKIGEIMLNRLQKLWLHPDAVFRCTGQYREQRRCLDILHGFSYRMIGERRAMIQASKGTDPFYDDGLAGTRKQLAFLDLLIEASDGGRVLSDADIREEVDTFILGGHDTTSTAISWTLFLLGTEPSVQERAIAEIDAVMGGDRERWPTMRELAEMRYLEACVKEALRLYPSIPVIGRRLTEDVQLDEYLLPAGTNAVIVVYQLHRDPAIFPNPDKFNPDHFLPSAGAATRHPFAYIPFSAGPRNCIGQKFGALEVKAVLVAVLRQFRVEAVHRREDLTLYGELVLRSKDGLKVRIKKRE
ncbi:cytochrome P450 4c3-like [Anopheles ziemanni]|uniref:cytochrome P450 4c3-like n=1 Tax=Anopheles coustani TaxID=139045 RepID=UPI00265A6698|nr:cytochrome P450 4c3-like [Anopheles coustani]XP_058176261.1 cytochrome P450 4c3-like [Anopheles ziemanni]